MSRNVRGTTAWDDELRNWPEGQREWAELAAASMLFADAAQDDIGPALAELRQTVSASGQTPTELFGEPVHYGRIRRRPSRRCARHGNIAVSPARKTTSPRISGTSSCSPRNLPPGTRSSIKRGVVLRRAGTSLLIGGFGVGLLAELLEGPVTAWLIIRGAMWLCLAAWILWSWLPKRIDADTAGARRGRVADARALSAQQSED